MHLNVGVLESQDKFYNGVYSGYPPTGLRFQVKLYNAQISDLHDLDGKPICIARQDPIALYMCKHG